MSSGKRSNGKGQSRTERQRRFVEAALTMGNASVRSAGYTSRAN